MYGKKRKNFVIKTIARDKRDETDNRIKKRLKKNEVEFKLKLLLKSSRGECGLTCGSAWSSFHPSLLGHGMRPNRLLGERRAVATMVFQQVGVAEPHVGKNCPVGRFFPTVSRIWRVALQAELA